MSEGTSRDRKSRQPVWLVVILVAIGLLMTLAALAYRQSLLSNEAREFTDHTRLVIQHAMELENAVTRMESRHRGFLLTGSESLQRQRERDFGTAMAMVARLQALVDDNPSQVSRLARIVPIVRARHARMLSVSATAAERGLPAAQAGFDYRSDRAFDPIITRLSAFREEERRLLAQRDALAGERGEALNTLLALGTLFALVLLLVGAFSLLAQLRRGDRLRSSLERVNTFNRLIMDNSPDVICVIDREGRFVEVSAASRKLFGYSPDEMSGRAYADLVHPDDREATQEAAALIMGGQPLVGFSNRYTGKDDRPVHVDWSAVWSEAEGIMFCVARDAAERRRAEQADRLINAELAAKAAELQHTNRELEAFSYTISHDLRAPLRHVSGYAQMLREDAADLLTGEMLRFIDSISQSARQMGILIDDLLAFSKLGRKPVERTETDMNLVVSQALHELAVSGDARISVGPLPSAHADSALLKQVWVNLLSNALKYSEPRGADARVQVTGEEDGDRIRYVVQDNGVGFDMRYSDKLFTVFQRLHAQEEFEGTGVGLAIVERILVRHGGSIAAASEPGRGAMFTFDLPCHSLPAREVAAEAAA